jgi:tetratricopeptide (TPR) repeat protein
MILCSRGKDRLEHGAREDVLEARALFQRSRELEPDYAEACFCLGETYFYEAISSWTRDSDAAAPRNCSRSPRRQRGWMSSDSRIHLCFAWAQWWIRGNYEMAEAQIDEAIALNPERSGQLLLQGLAFDLCGQARTGHLVCASQAIRRAPNLPEHCLTTQVRRRIPAGRFEQAIATFGRMLHPPAPMLRLDRRMLCQSRSAGRSARRPRGVSAPACRPSRPARRLTMSRAWRLYWSKRFPRKEPESMERLFAGLRKAGLPV